MLETPIRYAKYLQEFLYRPSFSLTTFDAEGMDEMIVQKGIPFVSLCAHHTLPFWGMAFVAYIPDTRIVGLSKLARTVEHFAHGFQNQERLTKQIAEFLQTKLNPKGVAVRLQAQHSCMSFRGVKAHGTETLTTYLTGVFKKDSTKAEFLASIS